jgi:uncharacterized protein
VTLNYSYFSPKLEVCADPKGGHGVYAIASINVGEVLTVWGGRIITSDEMAAEWSGDRTMLIQVDKGLYMLSLQQGEPSDRFNHSCQPNAGLRGPITLVAMRDIAPGEEVCFDYAMSDGSEYDSFVCACGTSVCRARVTGDDWKRPELWERYDGFFSPYLQRRIDALRMETK